MVALLSVNDVDVDVGGRPLLRGVTWTLRAGECLGLVGPSGAGKTSLLRILNGLDNAVAGTVTSAWQTDPATDMPAWRQGVQLVPQVPLMFEGSVESNLRAAFSYATSNNEFDRGRCRTLLEAVGLAGRHGDTAATLSVGEQQRVGLVRALLLQPAALLLDEPTSALDATAIDMVETLVRDYVAGGRGAIVVSHDAAQVQRLCDRALDLRQWVVPR